MKQILCVLILYPFVILGQIDEGHSKAIQIWLPSPESFYKFSGNLTPENTVIHNPRYVTKENIYDHEYDFTHYEHKNQFSVFNYKSFYRFLYKEIFHYLEKLDPYSDSIITDSLFSLVGVSQVISRKMKYIEDTIYHTYKNVESALYRFADKGYLNEEIQSAFSSFLKMKENCKPNTEELKFNVFFGVPRSKELIVINSNVYKLKIVWSDELKKINKKRKLKKDNIFGQIIYIDDAKKVVYFVRE